MNVIRCCCCYAFGNNIMKSCTSHVYKVTTGLWSIQIIIDDKCNYFSKQPPTPSDYNTIWGDISAISKQNVNTLLFVLLIIMNKWCINKSLHVQVKKCLIIIAVVFVLLCLYHLKGTSLSQDYVFSECILIWSKVNTKN